MQLDLQFYKRRPRRENQMIKKVRLVKYEGHDDDKKSLQSFFHENAITVEAKFDH
jgi:chorismate mutase